MTAQPEAPDTEQEEPQDATPDNPSSAEGEQDSGPDLEQRHIDALKQIRETYKQQWQTSRTTLVSRIRRAFMVSKNQPYEVYNNQSNSYNSIDSLLQGRDDNRTEDPELYQFNNNIYQMLMLTFISALSQDVPKTRYQPEDAENEEDLMIASKASTIRAYNERKNLIKTLQKLSMLHLWTGGVYFGYVRHVVDANVGVKTTPVYAMQDEQMLPPRYQCPACGEQTPDDEQSFAMPQCQSCGGQMGDADWHEGENAPMPVKVGEIEQATGLAKEDIYGALCIDADPQAQTLSETPILDFEIEMDVAAVRASYPKAYSQLKGGDTGGSGSGEASSEARRARQAVSSPSGSTYIDDENYGTYSRCWIQPRSFNILDDQELAEELAEMFPIGVKLVTYNDVYLQAVEERLTDRWTWCPMMHGYGLYPPGVGDAALDVQERINDVANIVHAYMDRLAFGTILGDAERIDFSQMVSKAWTPGNITPVRRKDDAEGSRVPLEDLMVQPNFHIDGHIFEYGENLIQLAQLIAGVQPQVFGGSDPNVQTAAGQAQMLRSALGRMGLFLDQCREELAARSENSVRCTIENMDDELRLVVEGDTESGYQNQMVFGSEVVGQFHAYPETDAGFPESFAEIQARVMQLLEGAQKNPFLQGVLSEPDTQKLISRYILPQGAKLPGDAERARIKQLIHMLSKAEPVLAQGPNGQPIVMPSLELSDDYDDPSVAVLIATDWLQLNWQAQGTPGFLNVIAFLRLAKQKATEAAAKQQVAMQAAQGPPPGQKGPPGPPPPPQ